jgi:hypothetical protein
MYTVNPFRGEDCPVYTQTRDGEHCGEAYAFRNFIPSFANFSKFGISNNGINEFSIPSSIATGVPFQAQSSMKRKTMLGFELPVCENRQRRMMEYRNI